MGLALMLGWGSPPFRFSGCFFECHMVALRKEVVILVHVLTRRDSQFRRRWRCTIPFDTFEFPAEPTEEEVQGKGKLRLFGRLRKDTSIDFREPFLFAVGWSRMY